MNTTERHLEKLEAGLEYDFWDDEVNARKQYAMEWCEKIHRIDQKDDPGYCPGSYRRSLYDRTKYTDHECRPSVRSTQAHLGE